MWIFGYGSLIWKVDFPYETKIVGFIKGYVRKFYQHSTDHRGTPENCCVWGVAYKITEDCVTKVIDHLDYREKGGYKRRKVTFFPISNETPFEISIYVGSEDNQNYAGASDEESIAFQIVNSVGPSGTNIEYLLNLAKSMREIAPHVDDRHLFNIETRVLKILHEKKGVECQT
ncbi:hypothetical protein RI129_011603 [Pyrocoelia pectoralis]|uniref:glutathione-specific gamma-glutamylcyclotransferase n=1 Tax=Pyrocoelia pectoralis TaxID=417401 RepID=A0AAN7ZG12_9COLE